MTLRELAISIISSIEKGYRWEDFKYSDYLYGEDEETIDFYRKYIEDE